MAVCELSGKKLPERTVYFSGYVCRVKDNYKCDNYRQNFKDGTNCYLLQRPVDMDKIRGILGLIDNSAKESGA